MSPCDVEIESVPARPKPRILSENATKPKAVIQASSVGKEGQGTNASHRSGHRAVRLRHCTSERRDFKGLWLMRRDRVDLVPGSKFATCICMTQKLLPLLASILFVWTTGCASELESEADDAVDESNDAFCRAGGSQYIGTYEGLPKYSNGCKTWQTKCVGRTLYQRNFTVPSYGVSVVVNGRAQPDVVVTGSERAGSWFRIGSCT